MNYKRLIIDSGLKMANSGFTIETWGNISCRDPETQLVYLTPSGMLYDDIVEDDIVVAQLDGTIVEGKRKPTIETEMHLAIYKNRPDVNAVIHTHPMYSMVYATQGKSIPLIIDEAAQILSGECKCAEYALPGSHELAVNCVNALGKKANSCLLQSHGAVCVAQNMDGGFKVAKVLEVTAQILYMIEATGNKPLYLSDENINAMYDFARNQYGQGKG
ncbi:MAG: class II aldolase/adducin family protein [Christensenella sp.]|nr:class II aldolase/adducin family protein [Christensenella sp.]